MIDGTIPSCADLIAPCEPTTIETINLIAIKTVVDADGDNVAEPGEVLTYTLTNQQYRLRHCYQYRGDRPITATDVAYTTGSTTVGGNPIVGEITSGL